MTENEINNEELINDEALTNEEILDRKLRHKLEFWGFPDFEVEEEGKGFLLAALSEEDIVSVYIDNENGICISYAGDSPGTDQDFIPNVSV